MMMMPLARFPVLFLTLLIIVERSSCFSLDARRTRLYASIAHENDEAFFESGDTISEPKPKKELPPLERAWRSVKKPLLSIGSKGASLSHGNSLKSLLEDHTIVKVKVHDKKFDTLEDAFETLRALVVENGGPEDIEMLRCRQSEKIILFGSPGSREQIEKNEFSLSKKKP